MAGYDDAEEQLRQLIRDDRWFLSAWPDVYGRVRRAARRQRIIAVMASAVAIAAVTAAVVVLRPLIGPAPPEAPADNGPKPNANGHASQRSRYLLPPVGARGFPSAIYPAPRPHPVVNGIGHCPAADGLQAFTAGNERAARALMPKLEHSFSEDLRLTDRTFWPTVQSSWQQARGGFAGAVRRPVLYAGPLRSYRESQGPPDFTSTISAKCGARLASDTWMIVDGPRASPAQQGEWLFLTRRGHVLLYYAQ